MLSDSFFARKYEKGMLVCGLCNSKEQSYDEDLTDQAGFLADHMVRQTTALLDPIDVQEMETFWFSLPFQLCRL